ncbi:MAG: TraR/DksA family transcriptional regulator [Propionivibrio sp.]
MAELTQAQVSTLVRRLDERVESLQTPFADHLEQLRDMSAPGHDATPPGDLADQADIERKRDEENDAITRETREMGEIETAFERLATGQADVCVECGDSIGYQLLLAQPTAVRCIACQAFSEESEILRSRSVRFKPAVGLWR